MGKSHEFSQVTFKWFFPLASRNPISIFLPSLSRGFLLKLLSIFYFRGKPVNLENLMNPEGKEFDHDQSEVLALIMAERSK